jgi:hypothetical protein
VGIRAINRRLSKIAARIVAGVLVTSLCLLPSSIAFADQVLELPQNPASSVSSPASTAPTEEPIHPHKHHHSHASESAAEDSTAASAPLPANLGTLQDYERDNDEDPSAGAASNFAGGPSYSANPANPVFELSGNSHQTLAQNAILGVLMIGLFAMEVQAAHHHHH